MNRRIQSRRNRYWRGSSRLTQEEIREEVSAHGLTTYPDIALLSALSAAGADAETIRAMQHAPGPRSRWGLALKVPKPTDYLYEIGGAVM